MEDVKFLLDTETELINRPDFIADDPVQFPRRYDRLADIEIAALVAATIAWGNRKMICRNADNILSLMDNSPFAFVMEQAYEEIDPDINLHRTFFGRHLQTMLRGLRRIYRHFGSLNDYAAAIGAKDDEAPAWKLVEGMQHEFREANGTADLRRVLPGNLDQTALKRINMALRWLVRDDGIVDMGVWTAIPKSKLFIPLDVHVGNVAMQLGLLKRKSRDRKAVEQLTASLRHFDADDPVKYDFALFGIGIHHKQTDF